MVLPLMQNIMKRSFFLALVPCLSSLALFAKVTLPTVFSDNMVLQQNAVVPIWGWSTTTNETIRIVAGWNNVDTVSVHVSNILKWQTTLHTPAAGGPFTIQIIGSSTINLSNVMVGEVWICSGQSNMEWSVTRGILNGEEEAAKAANPNIRIFQVQKMSAESPQQNCQANWTVCSPETMRETSAVGYFFARELQQKLNVPVGIIVSAWGGTPIDLWIEKSRTVNYPDLNSGGWWAKSGILYNAMIAPFVPYDIAGAIWYQGEANCGDYLVYSEMMKILIENWRSDFRKDFPFYFVQIAPYDYGAKINSQYLREQQEIASKTIPNTGMVVVSDLVEDAKNIHPKNKLDVGKRLANYALAETYKQDIGAYKSPMFLAFQLEKGKLRLSFSNVVTGLESSGKTSEKFMIAGDDRNFVPATASINRKTIVVSSKQVKNPVAVRFCFDNISTPDVFSAEGLPLAPFRTDNW